VDQGIQEGSHQIAHNTSETVAVAADCVRSWPHRNREIPGAASPPLRSTSGVPHAQKARHWRASLLVGSFLHGCRWHSCCLGEEPRLRFDGSSTVEFLGSANDSLTSIETTQPQQVRSFGLSLSSWSGQRRAFETRSTERRLWKMAPFVRARFPLAQDNPLAPPSTRPNQSKPTESTPFVAVLSPFPKSAGPSDHITAVYPTQDPPSENHSSFYFACFTP